MSDLFLNPTNTLLFDKPSFDVNEAIAFIPALSSKYKLVSADPALQLYTLSGRETSSNGVYIDIRYASNHENKTEVTLAVRRKTGSFEKSSDVTMANQHLDTLVNLLSDSLRLAPDNKSRLRSTKTNERSAGEHRTAHAFTKNLLLNEKQSFFSRKNIPVFLIFLLLFAVGLFLLYNRILH